MAKPSARRPAVSRPLCSGVSRFNPLCLCAVRDTCGRHRAFLSAAGPGVRRIMGMPFLTGGQPCPHHQPQPQTTLEGTEWMK